MTSLDWPCIPMSAISTAPIVYGIVQPGQHDVDGVPFVQTRDIGRPLDVGSLDRTALKIAAAYQRSSLKADDLILSLRGDIGASAIVPLALEGANISRGVARVRPKGLHDPHFIHYALQAPQVKRSISAASRGSTLREISIGSLRDVRVPVPPLPEQRKIAQILRTWDDAIERSESLMIRLRGQHRLLLQGLIARHAHGSHMALRDLVEPIKTKNTVGETNVLTSSARDGLVSQTEYFNKNVAGKNLAIYYLLHRDDFAYNRSSSAGHPFGAIRRLDRYDRGIISTLYLCFRLRNNSPMSGTFLQNIFNSEVLDRQLSPICHEGARSHGLLNIAQADFFELVVPVPSKEAQKMANKALAASSLEIELLKRKVALLRTQKRGLMQKLLTGQVRVNMTAEIEPGGENNE